MSLKQLKGTGVALVTPFQKGEIDYHSLKRVIEHTMAGGVDFLVSLGTTGESVTLSDREQRDILDFTRKTISGKVPLVAGNFGGNDTRLLVEKIRQYDFTGIDMIMSSCPAYNKPAQEGIFQHFMQIAEYSPVPIIIYNVPGRTAMNITSETVLRLAEASDKFIAVKEAANDIYQAMEIIKHKPGRFSLLSGDDIFTLGLMGVGADGVISVMANLLPAPFSGMVRMALDGDFVQARRFNELLLEIHPWLYKDGNPAGIKAAMEMQGLCSSEVRLPLVGVSSNTLAGLKKSMEPFLQERMKIN